MPAEPSRPPPLTPPPPTDRGPLDGAGVTRADLDAALAGALADRTATLQAMTHAEVRGALDEQQAGAARQLIWLSRQLATLTRRLNVVVVLMLCFMLLVNVSILQRVGPIPVRVLTDLAIGTAAVYLACTAVLVTDLTRTLRRSRDDGG